VVQCFDITRKVTYANMQKWYKSGFTCPPAPVRPSLRWDYRDYRLLRRDYRATAYCVGITGITGTRVVSHARRRRSAHHCVGLAWRAPREPRPFTHAQACTRMGAADSTRQAYSMGPIRSALVRELQEYRKGIPIIVIANKIDRALLRSAVPRFPPWSV
jgi:hypothetical protein